MFNRIHQKLGTAGFIISLVALVAALGGGAYAASGGLNGKQKKEVEKIARKYAGKPGPAGAIGPAGPAGKEGANGTNGTNGKAGEGVTTVALLPGEGPAGEECAKGGVEIHSPSGVNVICDGETGPKGNPGNPAEFPATLPPAKSESGYWEMFSMNTRQLGTYHVGVVTISYPIPLSESVTAHYLKEGETSAECPGRERFTWKAEPGNLCIYLEFGSSVFESSNTISQALEENSRYGASMEIGNNTSEGEGEVYAKGVWVLTAHE